MVEKIKGDYREGRGVCGREIKFGRRERKVRFDKSISGRMKETMYVLLIIFASGLGTSTELSAQSYKPPIYKNGFNDFSSYINQYIQIEEMLPMAKDYIETYRYDAYISKDGVLKFANVLGKDYDIRTEIKRVIRLCDKWEPGRLDNIAIDTIYTDTFQIRSTISYDNYFTAHKDRYPFKRY